MRREPTPAELLLHNALTSAFRPFAVRVAHQEPVGYYIADFMIHPCRIVVEVDGGYHRAGKQRAYDQRRDSAMKALGIRVLRFENDRVLSDAAAVAAEILATCGPLQARGDAPAPQVTQCPPAYAGGGKKTPKAFYHNLIAFNTYTRPRKPVR
jgi:very-short-patch-repair endonuclease